ncbi:MAG: hypothetical protein G01um101438_839 [Parcubacteria group bacterium Gr01-1014_38]|nr:MAG: hypothetical protein G01um101438_839 [Parcubacteria group bacterium Gr01-1014_38]
MALLPIQRQKEIDSIIEDLKLKTGLAYPENNLLDIAQAIGVNVYEVDFDEPSENIDGAIQYVDNEGKKDPKIFVNSQYPPERKTFTLAHELGHYLLHKGEEKLRIDSFEYSQDTQESREESEANYFAASLLVPKEKLVNLLKLTGGTDLGAVAKYFGVSKPVIENRIKWMEKNRIGSEAQ